MLTPGRYVGAEEVEDDGDPFEEKMPRLVAELHAQFAESAKLEQAIRNNLEGLGMADNFSMPSGQKETPAPIYRKRQRKDFRGLRGEDTSTTREGQE